ncbi:hypothetical protein OnM2_022043 [Erysiphe neolycopersici]|uniref:Uncharacterized protein n=1 Tax=Erysiphe neolycopersici TaxID=212602 RepID=A0A420I2I8_9PEZI|nr:hypothetical protein OnM2_022043 [Erysiphe neolycopersici]
MDHFMRIRDVFLDYLSPMAKRRRIFAHSVTSSNKEDLFLPTLSEHKEKNADATILHIPYQKYLPLKQCSNSKKRTRDEFEEGVSRVLVDQDASFSQESQKKLELKGDWEFEKYKTEKDIKLPNFEMVNHSESVYSQFCETDESESQASTESEDNEIQVRNAKVQEYLRRQAEFSLRKSDVERAKASGNWHPDELFLFERLSMRGFEVLLPKSWKIDFPTLPHTLFAEHENEPTFVNTNFTSSAYGVKALQSLLGLGARVRDNLLTGAPINKLISREINHYIKWSERDGDFSKMRFLPVLTVVVARPKQSIDALSVEIDRQMRSLAEKYREKFAISDVQAEVPNENAANKKYFINPPLLYGMIVARTNIIFVTLDSAKVDAAVRHMQDFDFREQGTEAWIGFAISILVIVARNYLMSMKTDFKADNELDVDVDL